MKSKFVKITVNVLPDNADPYSFMEWFCLDTTWTHPYNTRDSHAEEFQAWCEKNWNFETNGSVAPEVTIGGGKLNDGWGSDCVGRIAGIIAGITSNEDNENTFYDAIETVLESGEENSFDLRDECGSMTITLSPAASIIPDEDSVTAFGPYADRVRKELAGA